MYCIHLITNHSSVYDIIPVVKFLLFGLNYMIGKLITLEGIDGAGKSSFVDYIKNRLISASLDVLYAREPGGTAVGEKIRDILLDQDMLPMTEFLLYLASRSESVNRLYLPHLQKSARAILLLDRFLDSSIVYQGFGRGFAPDLIIQLHKLTHSYLEPDITFLFYCPLAIIKQRKNQDNLDRIEQMGDDFFEKLQNSYLELASQHQKRIVVIDNSSSVEQTTIQIDTALASRGIL